MRHRCRSGEDLALLLSLDPNDLRRRSAAQCPRCSSLLASMRSFLAPKDPIPEADRREAFDQLGRFLDLAVAPGPDPSPGWRSEDD